VRERTAELRADCGSCLGLCCVAPAFARSADFALDKPAGTPCPNLRPDLCCAVHDGLRGRGFTGCAVYDCFGAGQATSRAVGRDWRDGPEAAAEVFATFTAARPLHAMLWHLGEAVAQSGTDPPKADLIAAFDRVDALVRSDPAAVRSADLAAVGREVDGLLERASERARAAVPGRHRDLRGADLAGRRMRGAKLAGATLAGAVLIGADLRGADLRRADLNRADLRGADLTDADLTDSLFLSQSQLEAARGGPGTRLPTGRTRPAHWSR